MNKILPVTFLCLIACASRGRASDLHPEDVQKVIDFTSDDFLTKNPERNHFIMFYAPWCGHCKRLHPTWEKLGDMLNNEGTSVVIGKVDCTLNSGVCSKHDVTGYPTLKFFKKGAADGDKYRGIRDIPSFSTFINSHLEVPIILESLIDNKVEDEPEIAPEPPIEGLVELTEKAFDKTIEKGRHFILFYTPWCTHSQKIRPTWEKLAHYFREKSSITIARIDCSVHKAVCERYEVATYPTLLLFDNGEKAHTYEDERVLENLQTFVKKFLNDEDSLVESIETLSLPPAIVAFTGSEFNHHIKKGLTFVDFYVPWCGHCKRLTPTWEDLATRFRNDREVTIATVDCTDGKNHENCALEQVDSYPSLFLYKDGVKIEEYEGNRNIQELETFLLKHKSEPRKEASPIGVEVDDDLDLDLDLDHDEL